MNTYAVLN